MNYETISECYEIAGAEFLIAAGKETPSHEGVPWVLVDGKPNERALSSLIWEVCFACDFSKEKFITYNFP